MYNWVSKVIRQFCLSKLPSTLSYFLFYYYFTNSSSNSTIFSKPKTSRREHSPKTVLVILIFHNVSKLLSQISNHVKVRQVTVGHTIHWAIQVPNNQLHLNKQVGRPPKLDTYT